MWAERCATSASLGSVSIAHTPCAHISAAKQVKAPQSPSVPKSHLSAPKPSQLPACWGRILHKKFQFLPHPRKDFQPHPFPSSPPTPSLQAARSQMRRPQQAILFPPPKEGGKSQRERNRDHLGTWNNLDALGKGTFRRRSHEGQPCRVDPMGWRCGYSGRNTGQHNLRGGTSRIPAPEELQRAQILWECWELQEQSCSGSHLLQAQSRRITPAKTHRCSTPQNNTLPKKWLLIEPKLLLVSRAW